MSANVNSWPAPVPFSPLLPRFGGGGGVGMSEAGCRFVVLDIAKNILDIANMTNLGELHESDFEMESG
jgi:hypothetical protein